VLLLKQQQQQQLQNVWEIFVSWEKILSVGILFKIFKYSKYLFYLHENINIFPNKNIQFNLKQQKLTKKVVYNSLQFSSRIKGFF